MSKRQTLNEGVLEQYAGYIPVSGAPVDDICYENIDIGNFYNAYVKPRKPVKITDGKVIEKSSFLPNNIVEYLDYAEELQVERKHESGYGLGFERDRMSLADLVEKLRLGDVNHYLTTQYLEDEDDDENEENGESEEYYDQEGEQFNNEIDVGRKEDEGEDSDDDDRIVEEYNEDSIVRNDVAEEDFNKEHYTNNENNNIQENKTTKNESNREFNKGETFNLPHKLPQNDHEDHVVGSKMETLIETQGMALDSENEEETAAEAASFSPFSDESDWDNRDDYVDDYEEDEEEDENEGKDGNNVFDEKLRILRIQLLLQPPLSNLYQKKQFPLRPEFLLYLAPQQINLWMGANYSRRSQDKLPVLKPDEKDLGLGRFVPGGGTSSGLHHDHSDNLYILINGWKRFTMFPPSEARNLHTVGKVYRIYKSGVIDYLHTGWKLVRDDGAIIDQSQDINHTKSDDKTPPSFSKIPPLLLHLDEIEDMDYVSQAQALTSKHFPNLAGASKIETILAPGEMLYLPAGWFHEVTSYGYDPRQDGNENSELDTTIHAALNYWFAPPNGTSIETPYRDNYWANDFDETLNQISLVNEHPY